VILGSVYRPFFEGFKGVWPKKTREREGRLRGTSKVALKEKKRHKKRLKRKRDKRKRKRDKKRERTRDRR